MIWKSRTHQPKPVDPALTADHEALMEARARNAAAGDLVNAALLRQAALYPDDRNVELIDLCLELRSSLAPAPVGARVPAARGRVPFVPGRAG